MALLALSIVYEMLRLDWNPPEWSWCSALSFVEEAFSLDLKMWFGVAIIWLPVLTPRPTRDLERLFSSTGLFLVSAVMVV